VAFLAGVVMGGALDRFPAATKAEGVARTARHLYYFNA
jgi:hypothetical protein